MYSTDYHKKRTNRNKHSSSCRMWSYPSSSWENSVFRSPSDNERHLTDLKDLPSAGCIQISASPPVSLIRTESIHGLAFELLFFIFGFPSGPVTMCLASHSAVAGQPVRRLRIMYLFTSNRSSTAVFAFFALLVPGSFSSNSFWLFLASRNAEIWVQNAFTTGCANS